MDISESLSPRERPRDPESILLHPGLSRPRRLSLSLQGGMALSMVLATGAAGLLWLGAYVFG